MMAVTDRITYKPGWRFVWTETGDLKVVGTFDSSRTPGKKTRVGRVILGAKSMSDLDLTCAIVQQIKWLEAHEFAEFLRIDGKQVFPPHEGVRTVFPPPEMSC